MVQLLKRQQDYRAIAAEFAQEFSGNAVERDLNAGLPTYEITRLREAGLLTLVIPSEYGGAGENLSTAMKVIQAQGVTASPKGRQGSRLETPKG